jgi:hypothetical protein
MSAAPARATEQVTIEGRFNGPETSANGGYACGTLARFIPGPAEVTLRVPPPLDHPLDVVYVEDGAELRDGDTLVASARPIGPLGFEPPVRPTVDEALDAQTRHPFIGVRTPLSDCFVCGYGREGGLGLCFGPLAERPDLNGAVLRPRPDIPTRDGALAPEILWAALDCPSYTPDVSAGPIALLGRLSAELLRPVGNDETLVAVGWPLEAEGRKHHTASALLDSEGETVARARALWIEVRGGSGS